MSDQLKSQFLGILLASATAIGVITYEKLTKNFSYLTVAILCVIAYFPPMIISLIWENKLTQDFNNIISHKWSILIFLLTGITSYLWYVISRKQGVMVASIYEVKYIVIMSLGYIMFGSNKFTLNTFIGIILAMVSIYFISK